MHEKPAQRLRGGFRGGGTGDEQGAPATDDDAVFARAMERNGNVMLALSMEFAPASTPSQQYLSALEDLRADLELSPEEIYQRQSKTRVINFQSAEVKEW